MSDQLSLFDELDTAQKHTQAKDQAARNAWMAEEVACLFCGEKMKRATMGSNHGIIFNGWCIKAMVLHNRAGGGNEQELAWLRQHGINPELSKFDQSHWHLANFGSHAEHFNCYLEGCVA